MADTEQQVRAFARHIELTHEAGRRFALQRIHDSVDTLKKGSDAHTAALHTVAILYTRLREQRLWPLRPKRPQAATA